jgi:hypothetical protein
MPPSWQRPALGWSVESDAACRSVSRLVSPPCAARMRRDGRVNRRRVSRWSFRCRPRRWQVRWLAAGYQPALYQDACQRHPRVSSLLAIGPTRRLELCPRRKKGFVGILVRLMLFKKPPSPCSTFPSTNSRSLCCRNRTAAPSFGRKGVRLRAPPHQTHTNGPPHHRDG